MIWPLLIVAWFALSCGWLGWLKYRVKSEEEAQR